MNFFRRLGRTLLDLATSKKAIAAAVGMVATAAGQPALGAIAASFVLGQGIADHGKEAEKKKLDAAERWRASDEVLADRLRIVREGQTP